MRRPVLQPLRELIQRIGAAAGQYFNLAVRKIDRVAGNAEGFGDVACTGAKKTPCTRPLMVNSRAGGMPAQSPPLCFEASLSFRAFCARYLASRAA